MINKGIFKTFLKTSLFFTLFITNLFSISSQEVKSNNKYFFGEVVASEGYEDYDEAKDKALSRLSENISINISSEFETRATEDNGKVDESVKSIINTYTGITLKNLTPIKKRISDNWYVMYYMHKDSLNVIYNERKKLIQSLYEDALESEEQQNLSYALQLYYYSMILMNSIPLDEIDYYGENLRVTVNTRINNILSGVKFYYEGDREPQKDLRDVFFRIEYNGKPVELIDFSYIERDEPLETTGRGGRAVCRLTGACTGYSKLDVEIQYKFSKNKEQFKEVAALWRAVVKPKFNNKQTVELKKIKENKKILAKYKTKQKPQYVEDFKFNFKNIDNCSVSEEIVKNVNDFLRNLKTDNIKVFYENDTFLYNKLSDMKKFNQIELIDEKYDFSIYKTFEGWEVRSIPVFCKYPSLNKQSTEYLVLDFNKNGILQDVNFSVFNQLYETYAGKFKGSEAFQRRQILVKFLEKYRSAYQNRDMNTLERIFSDDAVIIVGRLMPKTKAIRDITTTIRDDQPDIEYLEMNKDQYLTRQRNIFSAQDDIHIGFNTCMVNQNNDDNALYGISMRQHYSSTGYSDEGYLFLLVDFKGAEPMIYVRSWQPSEWDENALIDMTNFRVKK